MRAAILTELGEAPRVGEVPEPVPGDGEVLLEVLAAPLNPLDVNVGSGRFYGGHPPLPYVPGAEAVGRLDGRLVWVFGGGLGMRRNGTFAEAVAVPREAAIPVPDGADPAVAAALGIAGVAGWLPLAWRAPVRAGETVLVLGATGTVGHVAVQAARLLGAARVVAAGRDGGRLERAREAGADATVQLTEAPALAERLRAACGGDGANLIVDVLWGDVVGTALAVAAPGARVVHVGQSAGGDAKLTSSDVRGKQLDVLGFSNFAVPREVLAPEYQRLVELAIRGDIIVDVEAVSLDEVAEAWRRQAEGPDRKLVLVP